mmetsp:Transcript_32684/g.87689  ORF Transcript_32684/g.87689 Transcript_32684/m.87689 type:complete len:206 (-) Transcript_32684:1190-1807(-)
MFGLRTFGFRPPEPTKRTRANSRNVRVALIPVRDAPDVGLADEPRVLVQKAVLHLEGRLGPRRAAGRELLRGDGDAQLRRGHIHRDRVAVLDQRDGAAHVRLRGHVPDDEAACGAHEAPVGREGHVLAEARGRERAHGRGHLAHAGPALWALVADDDEIALADLALLKALQHLLLAAKDNSLSSEARALRAEGLHDRTIWAQIAS